MTKTEIPYVTNILNESKIDQSFVLAGGMSGIGAKGSLTYGLIAANLLLNKKDTSAFLYKSESFLEVTPINFIFLLRDEN